MIRAIAFCAFLAVPGAAIAACPGPDGVTGAAMTGTWQVGISAANVNAVPMLGRTNEVVLQGSGSGVTLVLDGRRIALARTEAIFDWKAGTGAAVSASQAAVLFGCDFADMTKWQGKMTADGDVVIWRILALNGREAVLHWSLSGVVQAQGVFHITK